MQSLTAGHKNKEKGSDFNVAIAFWSLVDKYNANKNIYFIGTINNEDDLPEQFKTRAPMIKINLPKADARKRILTHHIYELSKSAYPHDEQKEGHLFFDASCGKYRDSLASKATYFTGRDLIDLIQCAIQCATDRSVTEKTATSESDIITITKQDLQKALVLRKPDVHTRDYVGGISYF